MCDFASGVIRKKDKEILIWDALHHDKTAEHFALGRDDYHEFEWLDDDRIEVRVSPEHDPKVSSDRLADMIRERYGNREKMLAKLWTDDGKLAAVQQDGDAIRFIEKPSEAVQMAAVQQDGYAIRYIEKPSEALRMAAVQQNGYAIEYIKRPSEALRMAAVQQNGYAIQFIKRPSEAVQMAAKRNK